MSPIGEARTPYTQTSQIPKGPGAEHRAEGVLEILPDFEAGLADIEGFSHLYVLWVFDRASGVSLVATLLHREGSRLFVRGVDMLDGTPVLDIKPYLSSVPESDLRLGWLTNIGNGDTHILKT